jgi:hypothetical protein
MYLADLSQYQGALQAPEEYTVLAIGWLDDRYPFPFGPTPVEFQERLRYVTDHEYRPPEAFIDAVMRCPLPYDEEYQAFMRFLGRETDDLTREWKE